MSDAKPPSVTIDGVEYLLDHLSDDARANLANIQIVDRKIAESQQELGILQTARNAYYSVLRGALPKN